MFAGVSRYSITFNEIKELFEGKIITKATPNRFFRSLKELTISIKPSKVSIKKSNDKVLVNNDYMPLNIFNLNHSLDNRGMFLKLKNRILKFIKHYLN